MSNTQGDYIEMAARRELDNSQFIRKESYDLVLAHLLNTTNILKTGNDLTLQEKKSLGLNPRRKITREFADALNDDGIRLYNPVGHIMEMWYAIRIKVARHESIEKLRGGRLIATFTLMSSGGGNDCQWCRSNQNIQFPLSKNIELLIDENCKCDPYCKCFINPVVEFG